MQLNRISRITGCIELISGLHIGDDKSQMHIGGTDSPVVRNPFTNKPYIPGSSIKGKMRSLMEWRAGVVGNTNGHPLGFTVLNDKIKGKANYLRAAKILKLFGGAPEGDNAPDALIREIGPTRLAFWDCQMSSDWVQVINERNMLTTELKMENVIDRISGAAKHPRKIERVIPGSRFDFNLSLRIHDNEDLVDEVLIGLKLIEYTGLGGSGSRGSGKLRFIGLRCEGEDIQKDYDAVDIGLNQVDGAA